MLLFLVDNEIPFGTNTEFNVEHWNNPSNFMDTDFYDTQSVCDTSDEVRHEEKIEKGVLCTMAKNKRLQHNAQLKKKNKSLIEIVKELKEFFFISTEIEAVLGVTPELNEIHKLQIRSMKKKSSKNKRPLYAPAIRKFAMTLNFYSPAAYKYIRRKFVCCLPHPKTLLKW